MTIGASGRKRIWRPKRILPRIMSNVTRLENGATFRAFVFSQSIVYGRKPVIPITLHILYERPQFIHIPNLLIHTDVRTLWAGFHTVAFWALYWLVIGESIASLHCFFLVLRSEDFSTLGAHKLDGVWLGFLRFSSLFAVFIDSLINPNGQKKDEHPDNV